MRQSSPIRSTRGFRVQCIEGNVSTLVECHGKLTTENAPLLKSEVKGLIGQKKRIVLDLKNVPLIDSSGLGTLVSTFSTATRYGGTIKLANLTKRFREQLSITKLVTVFDVYDSAEEAAKSFQ